MTRSLSQTKSDITNSFWCGNCDCIDRNRKNRFIVLHKSQNNCPKISRFMRNSVTHSEFQLGGCETQLGPLMCRVDCPYSPPPLIVDRLICGETCIYWVLRNNPSVHSVAVALSCDTLVLATSSSSSLLTSSSFFFLPWEKKSKLNLSRLSPCQFSN